LGRKKLGENADNHAPGHKLGPGELESRLSNGIHGLPLICVIKNLGHLSGQIKKHRSNQVAEWGGADPVGGGRAL